MSSYTIVADADADAGGMLRDGDRGGNEGVLRVTAMLNAGRWLLKQIELQRTLRALWWGVLRHEWWWSLGQGPIMMKRVLFTRDGVWRRG